ncbi:hypothetical protein SAMN05446927_7684 [Caballeronia arationis]|uniref:Uncharacterized protein n=1 Tax=Caballeronia arationis TaxID=1777142 RepID=A0A7Z7IE23_9BURK|nr:hypothetical protein SAMN05446927_7684 [Caballeronia arationis]
MCCSLSADVFRFGETAVKSGGCIVLLPSLHFLMSGNSYSHSRMLKRRPAQALANKASTDASCSFSATASRKDRPTRSNPKIELMHILTLLYIFSTALCLVWTAFAAIANRYFSGSWVRTNIAGLHPMNISVRRSAPSPTAKIVGFWGIVSLMPFMNVSTILGWTVFGAGVRLMSKRVAT